MQRTPLPLLPHHPLLPSPPPQSTRDFPFFSFYFSASSAIYRPLSTQDAFVTELVITLRELAHLFIVRAENLSQLCEEGRLARLDRAAIISFVQLREDFKSAKIAAMFKQ